MARFLHFFKADKTELSLQSDVRNSFTTPENAKYVIVTYYRSSTTAENVL
jgi:hypothetical protein